MNNFKVLMNGIVKENPTFVLLLGMCPTLLAALAESYSDHPISRSLKEAYGKEFDASRVSGVEELSGRGVRAMVDGRQVCAGNDKLMEEIGVSWHPCHHVGTTVHVAVDGVYAGHIVISDEVKPDAAQAVAALKAQGVQKTVMLTGDATAVGEACLFYTSLWRQPLQHDISS